MKIKIVNHPLQDENTKPENIQYPNEKWCVKTYIYREGDGGMNLWFQELNRIKPDIIYLYEIKAFKEKIVNGYNEDNWIEDTIYSIRADLKKNEIKKCNCKWTDRNFTYDGLPCDWCTNCGRKK